MKIKTLFSVVMMLCFLAGPAQAMEAPPVIDTHSCSFLPGKGADDLEGAIGYWKGQMGKIDDKNLNQYSAWLITPIRSSFPADFFWLGASPNVSTWMKGNAAYAGSSAGQAADERFAKVAKCTSGSWTSEMVHGNPDNQPEEGQTSILEAFGCTLKKGKTMSNVRAAEANFVNHAKAAGMEMNIFRFSPMYTNGETDLIYFVGHENADAYVANAEKAMGSTELRYANFFFELVMDCGSGLYNAENLRVGSDGS